MSKKVDNFIDEAISNIRNDRDVTKELLNDAINWLSKDESRHREIGVVMAKYLERLCRSNDQILKLAEIIAKEESKSIDPDVLILR